MKRAETNALKISLHGSYPNRKKGPFYRQIAAINYLKELIHTYIHVLQTYMTYKYHPPNQKVTLSSYHNKNYEEDMLFYVCKYMGKHTSF